MNRPWIWVPLCVLVAAFAVVTAQDKPAEVSAAPSKPGLVKPAAPETIEMLGTQVKLTFKIKGGELPGMTIRAATTRYAAQIQFEGDEGYANVDVSGRLKLLDDKRRLLLTYQSLVDYEGKDNMGHFSAAGSVIVAIGARDTALMSVGDKDLVVVVEPVR